MQLFTRWITVGLFVLLLTPLVVQAVEADANMLNFTGKIVYLSMEGGFYGIESTEGDKYNPMNLPPEFEQNGLRVEVQAEKVSGRMGIHMWGQYINILKITEIPCPSDDKTCAPKP